MDPPPPTAFSASVPPAPTPAAESRGEALLQLIVAMLRELRPGSDVRRVRLDDSIERDLQLDSLSRAELAMRIEHAFGVTLPDDLAATARTPRELLAALGDAASARTPLPVPPALGAPEEVTGTPREATSIAEAFRWHVERHPEREHVTLALGDERSEALSYGALLEQAGTVAAGLAASGVVAGDRVALMLPTGAAFFRVFVGTLLIGAVPVPMYPPFRWSQIEEHVRGRAAILANSGAVMLVTVPEARFVGRVARADAPALRIVTSPEHLADLGSSAPHPAWHDGEIALLQYTSGSTGDPKGVILSHANLLANIRAMGRAAAVTSRDRFVSWLPLYHDMGLIGAWLATMYHAVPLVVMPPASFLGRPSRWLRAIHRFRGTISAGPNFAYEIAASRIPDAELEGLDLSAWRLAFNGAEPVRAATLAKFAARFSRYGFDSHALLPVYGLAESAVGLTFPPLGRGPRVDRLDAAALADRGRAVPAEPGTRSVVDVVSCGHPLPGHEIRVVDEGGSELPSRAEGRIEFRGPSATPGYFANAEATRRLLRGGWLDTGDVGYVADGELFVTSRVKDLIKRGGHALHPYDLEAAVGELPGVRKGCVAAFGSTDHATGTERVVVVAELHAGDASVGVREALRARIAELATVHLGGPADEVVLVPPHTILKTSSGKIRRSACRELYERHLLGAPRRKVATQLAGLASHALAGAARRGLRTAARAAYGTYALALALVASAVAIVLLAVVPGVARRRRGVRRVARALLRLARMPVDVRGLERFPTHGAAVVVANHASYADAVVLTATLPPSLGWAAKSEFARTPMLGFVMRRLGTHFVARAEPLRGIEDTRAIVAAVREGASVGFFPEGTFTRAPGLAAFRLGAFAVAGEAGCPVVPVVLEGTRSLLRAGRWMPEHRALTLTILAPIRSEGRDWSAAVRLRDATRAAMLAACSEPDLAA